MQSTIAAAMAGVKAMATRLRPIALDALSFGETVGWFARDFERRTGIACRARIEPGVPPLSDAEATTLFRVLQEALSNVARHAKARAADISLRVESGLVVLEVGDDGVGADPERTAAPDAFGVIGMRERCAALGGSLAIESRPGAGTRLTARMPAQSGAGENDGRGRGC
jgi:signal transduction histidine kinase